MNSNAYIDGANLHKGVGNLKWQLDYKKFRVWLSDKYKVKNAYLFIGFISKNKNLYLKLQEVGYILVYKEITYDGMGKIKGNCDADLVLKTITDYYEKKFNNAVIVASDGDYAGLVSFLKERNVLQMVVSPSNKCSYLLRKLNIPLLYINTQKRKLENLSSYTKKEKAPGKDETSQGSFS